MSKPYYNKKHAIETARLLELLLQNPDKPIVVEHEKVGIQKHSLLNRLYNSLDYLCDELDPDGIWKQLREKLVLSVVFAGIKISMNEKKVSSLVDASREYQERSAEGIVERILRFLEDTNSTIFEETELKLSEDTLETLRGLLEQEGLICIIRKERVKIVKSAPPTVAQE